MLELSPAASEVNNCNTRMLTKSWPVEPPRTTSGAMYSMVPQNE